MIARLLGGAAVALLLAGAASAQPGADRHFLGKAIRGDNSEMMLGQMAENRAADPRVRDYGRMLHNDHAMARQQALPLARQFGVADTDGVMPQAREEARKLRRMNGRAFDREFARYMVHDHKHDISDFRKEAREHGPVARMARQTLPTLEKHLHVAESLRRG
ncbi:MAG: DUF4142 domain-containing protein [Alphaproteobacteria bacterium]|nr:DUF4142 domain-containing protein [Alphaproteobacteria bacterium]